MSAELAFRKELFTFLNALVMAERDACARIAEKNQSVGQCIARRIRDRPQFKLPPIALDLKLRLPAPKPRTIRKGKKS